mgnify:CR=1 FL=1
MLWLLAALLGAAALLVDTNQEYSTGSPFYRMLLYTSIAINGLLFHYKPTSAMETLDGKTHPYHHVWLAPTMVMYGKGKLKTLTVFPSIFKGAHIRHNEMVEVLTGHHIRVEFDRPTPSRLTARPSPTSPPMRSLAMAAALPDNGDTIYLLQNRHHPFASFFLSVWQGNFHCKGLYLHAQFFL